MGKRRKRRIYTCSDKILCGLGKMHQREATKDFSPTIPWEEGSLRRLIEISGNSVSVAKSPKSFQLNHNLLHLITQMHYNHGFH